MMVNNNNKFTPYINRGWLSQLLPIIPPNADISDNSQLKTCDAGKQPGFYNAATDKWQGMSGWSINTTCETDIIAWSKWPGDAVGIKTRTTPGIDIDIDNQSIADQVKKIVNDFTGGTAIRTRDNSSRVMFFLQLATGEIPRGKCRIILINNLGAVELLGAGQQAVLSGTHPSGAMQVFTGEPVIVSNDQLDTLWDAIINLLAPITLKVTKAGEINLGERRGGEIVHVATDPVSINTARQVIANTPGVGEGERDDTCYKMVTAIRQVQAITAETCLELMQEWGDRCDPPFSANEIKTRINSAYGGCARGAQGEYHPDYILQSADFGKNPVPDYVSPVPLSLDINKKPVKPKRDPVPIPVSGINDDDVPLSSHEWDPEHKSFTTDKPRTTPKNFAYMLQRYGINVAYDMVKKDVIINGPGMSHGSDISDNANSAVIHGLCKLNQLDVSSMDTYLAKIMNENEVNPVAEWIKSKPWDNVDRITDLFNTLTLDPTQDRELAWLLFRKWFVGACKIVQDKIHKFEFVLVLQDTIGGTGKTAWFNKLCPHAPWRKEGLLLDPTDKDSVKAANSHWLVELGELDSIFNKGDIKRLMSFLSNEFDEIRLPYARASNKYRRRTAFMGTVNKREFLIDDSGDRRFWPIAVTGVNYEHDIDMQQFWAQVNTLEERHYLDQTENKMIIDANKEFKSLDPIDEILDIHFNKTIVSADMECLTVTAVLNNAGVVSPTKHQLNKAGAWLREKGYEKCRAKGLRGYLIPVFALSL